VADIPELGPVDARLKLKMTQLATRIDQELNPNMNDKQQGFVLFLFPLNVKMDSEGNRFNYMSNADRKDVAVAMLGLLESWRKRGAF
jgi:hypothetical protein